MLLNADFSQPVVVAPEDYRWVNSPQNGVDRMMLDRAGGELARATSIVRYAPDSHFSHHRHPGGEEILVLSGTFSEGHAHYTAGWYLRNPPGSSHRPFSDEGAVIFVKLCQMAATETRPVRIDTTEPERWAHRDGRDVCELFAAGAERVCLQRLLPGAGPLADPAGGTEMLVLAGSIVHEGRAYPHGSWIRLPAAATLAPIAGPDGATIYLKTGHLGGALAGVTA